jgi:hypothetical protein
MTKQEHRIMTDPRIAKIKLQSTVDDLKAAAEGDSDEVSGFAMGDFDAQGNSAIMSAAAQHLKSFGIAGESAWNLAFDLTVS